MTETLQEFCDSRGVAVRVDRSAAVIRGVKVLGLESRNGRDYLPAALAQAAPLYEEVKVNVNHPKGNPLGPRDYQDRIGVIRNATLRVGEGLFADFHFNPKHALAEQLLWDAEHAPENVGFSHNVEARTVRRGERVAVEAITRVQSVDLVADPATTRGLFETAAAPPDDPATSATNETLTRETLERDYPALVNQMRADLTAEVRQLRAELDQLHSVEMRHDKQRNVRRVLREFRLPEPEATGPLARTITSASFWEALLAADDATLRSLVEDRARLVEALASGAGGVCETWPQSRDQHLVYGTAPTDARTFADAIT